MNKAYEIEKTLGQYLFDCGVKNEWFEGDEEDEEEVKRDLVCAFLDNEIHYYDENLSYITGEGGGEGEGEYVYAVFKFHGKFYKAEWDYYSHYGYDWDGLNFTEVAPRKKTITVYEKI